MNQFSEAWKVNDKAWLSARKLHWKEQVEPRLKEMASLERGGIRKRDLRYLKAYYLKGELLPYDDRWAKAGLSKKDYAQIGKLYEPKLIYQVWFYPEEDEAVFKEMIEKYVSLENQSRRNLWLEYYNLAGANYDAYSKYEFFDNRSYFLDKLVVPKSYQELVGPSPKAKNQRIVEAWEEKISDCHPFFNTLLRSIQNLYLSNNCLLSCAFELFLDVLVRIDFKNNEIALQREYENKFKNILNLVSGQRVVKPYLNVELVEIHRNYMKGIFDAGVRPDVDNWWDQAKKGTLKVGGLY